MPVKANWVTPIHGREGWSSVPLESAPAIQYQESELQVGYHSK